MRQRRVFPRNATAATSKPGVSISMRESAITDQTVVDQLAARILGWRPSSDRFIKCGRSWLPKWRFAPLTCLDDAFQLLDRSVGTYKLEHSSAGMFSVEVNLAGRVGRAIGEPQARAITFAVARALGIETPPDVETLD
jgi:hypothetical protein